MMESDLTHYTRSVLPVCLSGAPSSAGLSV